MGMTDLSTTYLGLALSNPLLVGASPLSGQVSALEEMAAAGAGAVVLPSLFEEQLTPAHAATADASAPALNLVGYNCGPEGYLAYIRQAKAAVRLPIIASLNATSPGAWVRYARDIEAAGADALELNIYHVPAFADLTGAALEQQYCDLVSAVKADLRIPVAVKLGPYFTSLPNMAARLEKAGAAGLVLFNRFYQPDFDIYSREITPTLELSSSQELRLRLHWVATLYGQLHADLAVTGGVHTTFDAVKALLAGACVIQMTAALLQHGIRHLERVRQELGRWLADNDWVAVRDLRGQMSRDRVPDPGVFERVNYLQIITSHKPHSPKGSGGH
jgi:dihydroorotate dehydrogenase (fumarate)